MPTPSSVSRGHNSYFLSLAPVDCSLSVDTERPASPSPSQPSPFARPPTPGGGPLSSHPTNPEYHQAGYFPAQSDNQRHGLRKMASDASDASNKENRPRTDSFHTPSSPASAAMPPPPARSPGNNDEAPRRPSGVRKLLSLRDLRASFSSSRTSLVSSTPRESNDTQPSTVNSLKRPSSPSTSFSTTASTPYPKRPQQLNKKKSGSWFRRKSGMFMLNAETDPQVLDAVDEDQRPETRESKRLRELNPAPPLLPELGSLGGGGLTGGGEVGWDDAFFKR